MAVHDYLEPGLGATVLADSYYPGWPPENAVDNNTGTVWRPSTTNGAAGHWWECDLNEDVLVDHIELNQDTVAQNMADQVQVLWSGDGVQWNLHSTYSLGPGINTLTPTNLTGRMFRFLCIAGGSVTWRIKEMELWADTYTDPGLGEPCDYDEILRDAWDMTGMADKSATLTAYGIPYLLGTGSLYNYLAFIICQLNNVWNNLGGAGGEHTPSNAEIMAAIDALDTKLDTYYTAIEAHHLDQDQALTLFRAKVFGLEEPLVTLYEALMNVYTGLWNEHNTTQEAIAAIDALSQTDLDAAVASIKGTDLPSIRTAQDAILAAINGAANGINAHTTNEVDVVQSDLASARAAILGAVANVQADTDDIQATLAALPSNSGGPPSWPGLGSVTLGTPQTVTGPALITGPMDGVLVSVQAIPAGQSQQPCAGVTRYKGLAWVTFQADSGDFEQLQQMQFSDGIFVPSSMLTASACAVYCKAGATLQVTPWTVNPS